MTHHPDCDGFVMHSVHAVKTQYGTYKPACPVCGDLPMFGSSRMPETVISIMKDHERTEECDGRCLAWK